MKTKTLKYLFLKPQLNHLLIFISFFLIAPAALEDVKAQTPGIVIKAANPRHENLMRSMNSMMGKIYSLKMSGNFDKDYVAIMQEFEQGGADLCKIYLMAGEDPKLLENAKVNAVELKEDQKQLHLFSNYYKSYNTDITHHNDLMETINKMITEMSRKAQTGNINNDFAAMMVLYNWAITELGKSELHYGLNSDLKGQTHDMLEKFSCNENEFMDWFNKNSVAKQ